LKSGIPEEIQEAGRIVICDNYYNTMDVINWIKEKKLNLIGTVRPSRFNLGSQWELPKNTNRGTVRVMKQVNEELQSQGYL